MFLCPKLTILNFLNILPVPFGVSFSLCNSGISEVLQIATSFVIVRLS